MQIERNMEGKIEAPADSELDIGGEAGEEEHVSTTEEGGQANKGGGRKQGEGPAEQTPEARASDKLLDKQIRKDEHMENSYDPEASVMKLAKNKNPDQPNGEIN